MGLLKKILEKIHSDPIIQAVKSTPNRTLVSFPIILYQFYIKLWFFLNFQNMVVWENVITYKCGSNHYLRMSMFVLLYIHDCSSQVMTSLNPQHKQHIYHVNPQNRRKYIERKEGKKIWYVYMYSTLMHVQLYACMLVLDACVCPEPDDHGMNNNV